MKRSAAASSWVVKHLAVVLVAVSGWRAEAAPAAVFLVKDGRPQAEIIIADQPPRTVKLAAAELQAGIAKISGARLAITNTPGAGMPVKIYVGRSAGTDKLGIKAEELEHGAFKMVAGDNFLALVGRDSDFQLKAIHKRNAADNERVQAEWDKATGAQWEFPYGQVWKEYCSQLDVWEKDERGSFNAVARFLQDLGVRWYVPGELGEIVPQKATLELPRVDRTVVPDFPVRFPYQYGKKFGGGGADEVLWQLRMGFNQAPDLLGIGYIAHGTAMVLARDEMKAAHPDYYALIGGQRMNGEKFVPCLSSEGLFRENVKMVRAIFDLFDAPMVSVMPTDGFTATCQCDGCKDQPAPERGWLGQYSDYVWAYVDRVAREVYKTHPDRKIVGMAYGSYLLPPEKIATFSPNIVVLMAQNRASVSDTIREARTAYLAKLPAGSRQFMVYDYYLHGREGNPLPVFYPHAVAADLKALKPFSLGDYIEVYRGKGLENFAAGHLNLYVTAQYWWNADQDVEALLEEYYRLFYGPAGAAMKAYVEYCEANWADMKQSAAKIDKAFELAGKARAKAPADSVYAQRVAWVVDTIEPLKKVKEELAQGRGDVPQAKAVDRKLADLALDGAFTEKFWDGANTYELKELKTGQNPVHKSSFEVAWADDTLCLAITCYDSEMGNLNIGATRNEDTAIWRGDCVEINIETPIHSHYQIAISPAGAVTDLDRKGGFKTLWSSNAKVAAGRTKDAWTLEVSIPVVDELQGAIDELHGVTGAKPAAGRPWYFNVCRQRMRTGNEEYSAFSPPMGPGGFNVVRKYGALVVE